MPQKYSSSTVCVVLASDVYQLDDYIKNIAYYLIL